MNFRILNIRVLTFNIPSSRVPNFTILVLNFSTFSSLTTITKLIPVSSLDRSTLPPYHYTIFEIKTFQLPASNLQTLLLLLPLLLLLLRLLLLSLPPLLSLLTLHTFKPTTRHHPSHQQNTRTLRIRHPITEFKLLSTNTTISLTREEGFKKGASRKTKTKCRVGGFAKDAVSSDISEPEEAGPDIKKKVLRAGCLAQLRPPRPANCLLPGLITSLCYSVNARRKPLCLPPLNYLSLSCTYTYYLNAMSRTTRPTRERGRKC